MESLNNQTIIAWWRGMLLYSEHHILVSIVGLFLVIGVLELVDRVSAKYAVVGFFVRILQVIVAVLFLITMYVVLIRPIKAFL